MIKSHLVLTASCWIFLTACSSTMDKSECEEADRRALGLADGKQGKTIESLGKRQDECSRFNIEPDLNRYRAGYNRGLKHYCQAENGFYRGKLGHAYEGVCPSELEQDFLDAYKDGVKLYALDKKIERSQKNIRNKKSQRERYESLLFDKKQQLASPELTTFQQQNLQSEISRLEDYIRDLESTISRLQHKITKLEFEYSQKNLHHNY